MQPQSIDSAPSSAAAATKSFVRDMKDKDQVSSIFLVREKTALVGKNGKPYLSLSLGDSSGAVDARIWDNVEQQSELFQNGDVVRVKGVVQLFQGRRQFIVHRIEKAMAGEYQMQELMTSSQRNPEEMMAELITVAELIEDVQIRQLTLDVLNDTDVRSRMLQAPAAKSIHHAYAGGLLEHILSICGLMRFLFSHYRAQGVELKLDYLLFGAIFHDIGKVWELEVSGGISYSDRGRLLGHMALANELIDRKAARILGFSEEKKDLLKHIVLSHHGRLEYGSPKTPMFLEAFMVAAIDDFDSKMNSIDMFLRAERSTGEKWSRYSQLFERHFLLRP